MMQKLLQIMVLALAIGVATGGMASAFSVDPLHPSYPAPGAIDRSMADTQARQRMQRGLDGLRDQQMLRELDRQTVQPQRLEIPKMRSTCQKRIQGNKFITVPCG